MQQVPGKISIIRTVVSILFVSIAVCAAAQPKAAFNADVTEGCTPLVVKFTDASSGNPTSWKWDLGNGNYSTLQDPGIIYITPGTYSIKLVTANANGIDSVEKVKYITVHGLPEVSFTTGAVTGCAPFNVQFSNTSKPGAGTIAESVWDFGDGQITKAIAANHQYGFSGNFSVTLSITNSYGCKASLQKKDLIKIPDGVKAKFDYSYFNVCVPPAQVDFKNLSSSGSVLTHSWNFGDGTSSTQENPSHTYTNGGDYTIQLIAKTASGCLDTFVSSISIGAVKADFRAPDSVCINQPLLFTNLSSPLPISVSWEFGDGQSSEDIEAVYAYKAAGTYKVTMTADFGNCNGAATKTVVVTNKPKPSFTTTGKLISCALPLTVGFNSTTTGAVAYKWLFGDGQSSSLPNPSHSYTTAGTFSVSLVAFNTNGCSDTITYADLVKTGPAEIAGFVDLPVNGCAPHTVDFKAIVNSVEPVTAWLWEFGDGTTSTLENPSHLYNNTGSYDVKLSVTSQGGCKSSYTLAEAVKLGLAPKPNFIATPLAVCAKTQVSFLDKSTGDVNEWLWFFGDGGTSTIRNPDYKYMDTGLFTITLIAKNNNCADTLVIEDYIEIFPPIAKFNITLDCKQPYSRSFIDKSIGAKTWEWDFGDGTTSNLPSPNHTYAKTGRYGVSLRVTNGDCDYVKSDSVFVVDEDPTFTYTPENKAICKNDGITFTAGNFHEDAIANFLWQFGDGKTQQVSASVPQVLHPYGTAGSFNPVLIATDINGCRDTVDQKLKIDVYGPKAAFTSVAGTCVNTNIVFIDNSTSDGIHPIVNWKWSYGDGTVEELTTGPFDHSYKGVGTYTIALHLVDSYGCRDSLVKNKSVTITKPVAKFTESDTLTCSKNVISFKNSSNGNSLTYSWSFGDGKTGTAANPSNAYANAGIYTVKLIVKDRYGCLDSVIKHNLITVSNPIASFILNDTVGICPPLLIEPQNTSKNYISLNWDFGDASNTVVPNPQHFYNTPGTYDLRLIVKGYGQCYDTATKKIRLKGPSGNLNYDKLTGCVPTEISFSSVSKNVAEYIWDFNNGVVKHTKDSIVKFTYQQHGSYLPKLVLVDSAGCKVSVENKDRIVISDVTAGIKLLKDISKLYCDSSLFAFNDSSKAYNDEIKSYNWNFGDNNSFSGISPTHFYNKAGTYNVTLSVVTKVGCTDSILVPVNVTVNKKPDVALQVVDSLCDTAPIHFYARNVSPDVNPTLTYNWSFGDGSYDTKQNAIHTYTAGGTYTASVKGTATNGCTDVKSVKVTVYKTPKISASGDSSTCLGKAVPLKATGATTYLWTSSKSLSCNNCAAPLANPDSSAWYYVTGTSTQGCKSVDSVFVRVHQPVQVTAQSVGQLCLGQSTVLAATGSLEYEWSPKNYLDNPYSANPVFKPAVATNITYTVIGKDGKNCFTDTSYVSIKVHPMPTMSIAEKSITANAGFPVKIETTNSPDITKWKWTPAIGLDSPFAASPTATAKNNITYQVVASNEGDCSVSEEVSISVLCDGKNIFIPNTFSPNNDGMNDAFFPRGKGIMNIKSLRIFNRWGTMVFERMNFNANTASEGWNGTYQGKPQALDVYVYVMEVVCDNGTVNRINGNVTLLQ